MAALGDRRFRDFTELRDSLPKGKILVPNEKNHIYYKEHYKMFRDLYLKNLNNFNIEENKLKQKNKKQQNEAKEIRNEIYKRNAANKSEK